MAERGLAQKICGEKVSHRSTAKRKSIDTLCFWVLLYTYLEVTWFTENNHCELLVSLKWKWRVAPFLWAPVSTNQAVSNYDSVFQSWIEVEGDVSSFLLISQVDCKPTNSVIHFCYGSAHLVFVSYVDHVQSIKLASCQLFSSHTNIAPLCRCRPAIPKGRHSKSRHSGFAGKSSRCCVLLFSHREI